MHSIALNIVESLAPFCQIGFYDLPQPSSSLELGEYIIKTPCKITGWNLKITTNWKIIWTKPPFLGSSRYREFSRLYSKSITKCLHNTFFKSPKNRDLRESMLRKLLWNMNIQYTYILTHKYLHDININIYIYIHRDKGNMLIQS